MSIAGKIKNITTNGEQGEAQLHLEGIDGESAGQSRMFVQSVDAQRLKSGADIWGSGSSVEITNPDETSRHIYRRVGYTGLVYEKTLPD